MSKRHLHGAVHLVFGLGMGLLLAQSASATIFSSIHSIEQASSLRSNLGTQLYDYQWTIQDWETTAGSNTSAMPNPCYGLSVCSIAINLALDGRRGSSSAQANPQCGLTAADGTTRVRSMGELGELYKQKCALPISGHLQHTQQSAVHQAECVGLFYSTTGQRDAVDGQLLPGSRCLNTSAKALGYCEFNLGYQNFNHGVLTPAQISSGRHSVTHEVMILCSRQTVAQVFLTLDSSIHLGSGISSYITTGNSAINGFRIQVQQGRHAIMPITSTLRSSGNITGGKFSGSATLIVTIP